MSQDPHGSPKQVVVGIDVGGMQKGFHAVALLAGRFVDKLTDPAPAAIAEWCRKHKARVIAVDAPCRWSQSGPSRLAERELKLLGRKIHCFSTPTRDVARSSDTDFYGWVFNAEELYQCLEGQYPLYKGQRTNGPVCIETFPHAVVCFMAGRVVSAKPKATRRREALKNTGHDVSGLPNIDFVDAALCAVAADAFCKGKYQRYGDPDEGFIVVPALSAEDVLRGSMLPVNQRGQAD